MRPSCARRDDGSVLAQGGCDPASGGAASAIGDRVGPNQGRSGGDGNVAVSRYGEGSARLEDVLLSTSAPRYYPVGQVAQQDIAGMD